MKTVQEVIEEYKKILLNTHSPITVKNYISDIYHFTKWFASYYGRSFQFDLLSKSSISEYKRMRGSETSSYDDSLSNISIQRHLSSLRSFSSYLKENELIEGDPFEVEEEDKSSDLWRLGEFKQYLIGRQASDLTIKYYINDIKGVKAWILEVVPNANGKSPHEILSENLVLEYKNRLTYTLLQSPLTINRKLSSIRNYASFLKLELEKTIIPNISGGSPISKVTVDSLIIDEPEESYQKNAFLKSIQKSKDAYLAVEEKAAHLVASSIISNGVKHAFKPKDYDKRINTIDEVLNTLKNRNIKREFFAPQSISEDLPTYKKVLHHIRHTRPKWYKEYHTYPIVHYLHFSVLVGTAVIAGFFVYNTTLGRVSADLELQRLKPNAKILSFRGKLLDKNNNPITSPTDVQFAIYTSPTDKGPGLIWKEVQNNITPQEDGTVNLIVGSVSPIPQSLIDSDIPLYLGVKIGEGEELTPRKPIGSAFSTNTETVQGMLPITSSDSQKNVLLALDGSGNLSIGGVSNPKFQATGGEFTFSGETLVLATNPSSNGNILITPDGDGKIEVGRAIISKDIGKNFGIQNLVEIEGGLGIMATSSSHAAIVINQNSRGDLISASTGGIARFVVDNQGTITKGSWAGDFLPTNRGGLGENIAAATAGEILYSISSTRYGTLKSGIQGQCLISQGMSAPLWSSCGGLTQLNGSLFTTNSTLDFLIGGNSTTSARFAFVNMNKDTPTFKVGSALGIDTNGLIQAYNDRDLTIGSSSTKNILLASAGNVGIGNKNPSRTLDVTGTFGGNTELYVDGAGTRTITISGKALIYDLEKSTAGDESDGTTTYNITGLPDINGTIAYLYLKVSKGVTTNPRTQTVHVQINGTPLATVSTTNPLLSSEEIKHVTVLRSNNTWHIQGEAGNSNTSDLAEWTQYVGDLPAMGEVVSISESGALEKSQKSHDTRLAGVITTKPAITIGPQTKDSVRLALSGRIPVIVTTIGGDINSGDPITSSDIPGIGMKPQRNSPIIGKALSSFPILASCKQASSVDDISWPEDSGTNEKKPCFKVSVNSLPTEISNILLTRYGLSTSDYIYVGKVMVLAHLSWSQTDNFLSSTEAVTISEEETFSSNDKTLTKLMDTLQGKSYQAKVGGRIIEEVKMFSSLTSALINSGLISTKNAVISGTLAAYNIVGNTISAATADIETLTSGSIKANTITSPLARVNTIQTDTIEPISEDLAIKLSSPSSKFQIKNSENEVISSFDTEGNATFSGSLTTSEASVSGTLRAEKLIAGNIEGLENQVSSFATKFLDEYEATTSIPSYQLGESILTASVSASFGTFHHGLISLGASTFGSLTAIDQITVGTDFVLSEGGINTLGRTLELQPLRQGAISLMGGAVTIETDGRLIVSNDAIFAKNVTIVGNLYTSSISNVPGKNLSVALKDANLQIKSASDSAVFEVNPTGDVSASGSGTFSKLNFQLVGQAIAANDLEAYATTSAGTAFLKAYRPELTIYNGKVTENSLIYITPSNNTDNQVLYLLRQVPNTSFTVGVSQVVDHDVQFNWMIIN